ncbi:glycosyltransferase [Mycobacteroides abscessus subsp. abscessus]|nr:glycosyltransferase [Mycobacteroides abscessus subsp. abscessus]
MKIAVISAFMFDNSIGGVENHIRFICKEFLKKGYEITLFKPVWEDNLREDKVTEIDGMTLKHINIGKKPFDLSRFYGKGTFGYFTAFLNKSLYNYKYKKIYDEINRYSPDLIWQHDFSSSWLATKKLSNNYKVILTNHTGEYLFFQKYLVGRLIVKRVLSHYSAIIGPSIELTPRSYNKKTFTIHNGVDTAVFKKLSDAEIKSLKEKLIPEHLKDKFIIFCPRRWAPTKGVKYLADAIKVLEEEGETKDLLFLFAGDKYTGYPLYTKEIESILSNSNANIIKLGNLDVYEIAKFYQLSDLVVIPSLMEAVSLSALEAMACGTPVLSTDVGGLPEIIEQNKTGIMVKPQDATGIAKEIITVFNDRDKCAYISQNAHNQVKDNYTWREIANQTEDVIKIAISI